MSSDRHASSDAAVTAGSMAMPGTTGVGQSGMATGYIRSRVFVAAALTLCVSLLAITWDWSRGWFIVGAAMLVYLDGIRRLRAHNTDALLWPLFIDVTASGAAVLFTDLPPMIVVAPLFYNLVAAVFTLSRRWSLAVTVYASAWTLVIVRYSPIVTGSSLTGAEKDLCIAIAVVIYLAATFITTSTAANAVRERQRLNDDLSEKVSRLQAVVDSTPIVLYALDNDGFFTLSEGPGLHALGLEPGQVVGLHVADVYGDNPEVLEMVNAALASDTDTIHEVRIGEVFFAVRHRPQLDASGVRKGTVGVAMDVTAKVRYREELEEQIRARDEFVASVSHELRTPLTVVYGLGEELRINGAGLAEEETAELHALLSQQAGEVVAIVEDLLVAARADIDRLIVVGETVDIGSQVSAVLQAIDHNVEVDAPEESVAAWCDGARCRQILRNLVVNASRHGGGHIRLRYGYHDDHVFVEVQDDGEGVPSGEETSIFDAYHSSKAASGNPASIGLGLTVARTLARLMDGDLSYERRGAWSTFTLTVPAASSQTIPAQMDAI
jgi:PAS domain S-box-containing protein